MHFAYKQARQREKKSTELVKTSFSLFHFSFFLYKNFPSLETNFYFKKYFCFRNKNGIIEIVQGLTYSKFTELKDYISFAEDFIKK